MKEKAEKILDLMISGLEKAGEIAQTELPKLVEDYVRYFIIQELPVISFAVLLFGIALFVLIVRFAFREEDFRKELAGEAGPFVGLVFIATVIVPFAFLVNSSKDVLALAYAPKAALIERFRK